MRAKSELMGTSCRPTTVGHSQKYLIMGKSGSDDSLFDVLICFTVHAIGTGPPTSSGRSTIGFNSEAQGN